MTKFLTFCALILVILVVYAGYSLNKEASLGFLAVSFCVVAVLFLAAYKITKYLEKVFV